jgi:DNA polymerase epsilon subunit 1
VLWARDPALPDLGVEEKDGEGGGLMDAENLVLLDGAAAAAASSSSSEVQAPGAYRSICVELRLHHLAVSAVEKVSPSLSSVTLGGRTAGKTTYQGQIVGASSTGPHITTPV